MDTLRFFSFAPAMALLAGCAGFAQNGTGRSGERLTDCPSPPRCMSSQAEDARHRIAPLQLTSAADKAWAAARAIVESTPRTTLVESTPDYLRAEVASPWHFYTDDLELLLREDAQLIDVRSSGRIGYYDFDVNRDRIEAIRRQLAGLGLVSP